LPAFPTPGGPPQPVWATSNYDKTLWFDVPQEPSVGFYRGNFCGIALPDGLSPLPGMAGYTVPSYKHPPVMALDIPRFPVDQQIALLDAYASRGYTHLQCSIGHAAEQGLSIDAYIDYCGRARQFVPFLDHWFLGGGNWNARDMAIDYWRPIVDPWIDALLANDLIDCACVGWQLDGYNTGTPRMVDGRLQSPIQSIIDHFADRLVSLGKKLGTHWMNAEGGAWNDPYDRVRWWRVENRDKLQFWHDQGDVDHPIDLYQAKLVDKVWPLEGTDAKLVVYECSAQAQFDLRCTEDQGDLKSYLLLCTKVAVPFGGYGNGARRPDGSSL
jgi:hypothetical protein